MRALATAAVLLLLGGCAAPAAVQSDDPLCAALRDAQAAGLVAAVSGLPGTLGDQTDRRDADARLGEVRRAFTAFVAAAPEDIREDSERVTAALERFVTGVNDPVGEATAAVTAAGRTPEEQQRTIGSARRINAVTQERCGDVLIDPAALAEARGG